MSQFDSEALPEPLPADPLPLLARWLDEAAAAANQPNPHAMTLATLDTRDRPPVPAARVVLCKAFVPDPGYIVFYTNYASDKAAQLDAHPNAAAVFHWDHVHRQVRVQGRVVRSPSDESDGYFSGRSLAARIGAWASRQSAPIASRRAFIDQFEGVSRRFGVDPANPPADADVPRPPFWGGYRLHIDVIELWVGAAGRLHDRARWEREPGDTLHPPGPWRGQRLQP